MTAEMTSTARAIEFVKQIARLSKDGECSNCGGHWDDPECTCDPEDSAPFDMASDDAVDALHSLISQARTILHDVDITVEVAR